MRILAKKITTINDIDELIENDNILCVVPFGDIWFGELNHNKKFLKNAIYTYQYCLKICHVNTVLINLYTLNSQNNILIYKILDKTSINLIKMSKSFKTMSKLLKEIKTVN